MQRKLLAGMLLLGLAIGLSACRGFFTQAPVAVLNADDPALREWGGGRRRFFFGLDGLAPGCRDLPGVFLSPDGGRIIWRGISDGGEEVLPIGPDEVPLPGRHNLANVLAALAVGRVMGVKDSAAARAVCRSREKGEGDWGERGGAGLGPTNRRGLWLCRRLRGIRRRSRPRWRWP